MLLVNTLGDNAMLFGRLFDSQIVYVSETGMKWH